MESGEFCVDDMIEGYKHMAAINLNFAELGVTGDLLSLEDYEFTLVETSEYSGY